MSKRKKILFVVFFVAIDLFLLYGFIVIRNATEENKLKKEVRSLIELDITKDRYDRPIKTRGNYALIEKTIKKPVVTSENAINFTNKNKLDK